LPKSCAMPYSIMPDAFPASPALRINSVASAPVEIKARASMASSLFWATRRSSSGFAWSFLRPAI